MKKFLIAAVISCLAITGFAQNDPIYVYVETQVQGGDTLRTFYVEDNFYVNRLIESFTNDYGTPTGAGSGTMKWTGVDISGIGNNLVIHANDGVQAFDGTNWSHLTYTNAADLQAKLYHDPARARRMYLTVKKGSNNVVETTAEENTFVSMCEAIMLAE